MPSLNRTRIDRDAQQNGVFRPYRKAPGVEVKIAAWMNNEHKELLQQLSVERAAEVKAHADQGLPDDVGAVREINAEAIAKTVVRDWKGVTEGDEKDSPEVTYTWEACFELLMDVELPFYDDMIAMASSELNFRRHVIEGARKK